MYLKEKNMNLKKKKLTMKEVKKQVKRNYADCVGSNYYSAFDISRNST